MAVPLICYTGDVSGLLVKQQELIGRYIQHRGDVKQRIQGNRLVDVGGFNVADEGGGALHPLRKLLLSQAPELAVVGDLQADLAVFRFIFWLHAITSL